MDRLDGADGCLYGMMQHLMAAYADQRTPERPAPRGVVERQDALDAVIQLAAVLDEAIEAGRIPPARGQHAAAMLMLIREYIQPLPQGLDADGVTDNLTTAITADRGGELGEPAVFLGDNEVSVVGLRLRAGGFSAWEGRFRERGEVAGLLVLGVHVRATPPGSA